MSSFEDVRSVVTSKRAPRAAAQQAKVRITYFGELKKQYEEETDMQIEGDRLIPLSSRKTGANSVHDPVPLTEPPLILPQTVEARSSSDRLPQPAQM